MTNSEFLRKSAIPSSLTTCLRPLKFRRYGLRWNRKTEETIHCVGLQCSRWDNTFTINLGVFVEQVWEFLTVIPPPRSSPL